VVILREWSRDGVESEALKLIYRQHAIKRMHERRITEAEIHRALETGQVIENYPNDTPHPSALLLGMAGIKAVQLSMPTAARRPNG